MFSDGSRTRSVFAIRRRGTHGLLIPVVLLCSAPAVSAQEREDTLTRRIQPPSAELTLGELYRQVHRTNPRALAARSLASAAEARVPGSRRPPDPQLQLGFMNYELPGLKPMDPIGMTQLQLMQMVPMAGKLALAGKISMSQALAQRERASDVEWSLRFESAMVFYDLYQTDQALRVARETLRLVQDLQRTAASMYRAGEGRQADVLRAQLEVARMTEDTIRMQAMRAAMLARLNSLLDRSADAWVPSPVLPVLPDTLPALEVLVTGAELTRPMVKAGARDVEAADASVLFARREIWPDLTLGIQYGQRSGLMGTERMGSFMVGATVPLFARSRQLRMREEAAAMQGMARAELSAMRADTRARVAQAHANLTKARRLLSLYRSDILPQAEATVTSSLSAYRQGSVNFMTALESRMTVNQYRQDVFVLESEQGKAWAELEMLLGRELFNADVSTRDVNNGESR